MDVPTWQSLISPRKNEAVVRGSIKTLGFDYDRESVDIEHGLRKG